MENWEIHDRVFVLGKQACGEISFIGKIFDSVEDWYGVTLDEPKGRSNGILEGVRYFRCPKNHGVFVSSSQMKLIPKHFHLFDGTTPFPKKVYPNYLKRRSSSPYRTGARCTRSAFEVRSTEVGLASYENKHFESSEAAGHTRFGWTPAGGLLPSGEKSIRLGCGESQAGNFRSSMGITELMRRNELDLVKAKRGIADLEARLQKSKEIIQDLRAHFPMEAYRHKNYASLEKQWQKMRNDVYQLFGRVSESEIRSDRMEKKYENMKHVTESVVVEKEMAELRAEEFESLLNSVREKNELLELDSEIKKEQMQLQRLDGEPAFHYVRHLESRNAVLESALFTLRDMYLAGRKELEEARGKFDQCLTDLEEMKESAYASMYVDAILCELSDRNFHMEEELANLRQNLEVADQQIETTGEIEEVLSYLYNDVCKELEASRASERRLETALHNSEKLLRDKDERIEKYRAITSNLQKLNKNINSQLEDLKMEREEAVAEAENLKIRVHAEARKSFSAAVQDKMMKIDKEIADKKINYWSMFFPAKFYVGNEYRALEAKLFISKTLMKTDVLIEEIDSNVFGRSWQTVEDNMWKAMLEAKFISKLRVLQCLLEVYEASLNNGSTEHFLKASSYLEVLQHSDARIDSFLDHLTNNELDRESNLTHFSETLNGMARLLNAKSFCPRELRAVFTMKCQLNIILTHLRLAQMYFEASPHFESSFKSTLDHAVDHAKFLLPYASQDNEEGVCLSAALSPKVEGLKRSVEKATEALFSAHRSGVVELQDELLQKFEIFGISRDLAMIRQSVRSGEDLAAIPAESSSTSSIFVWIQLKEREKDNRIRRLHNQMRFYQKKIASLSEYREVKKLVPAITATRSHGVRDKCLQTVLPELEVEPEVRDEASIDIRLQDMELMVRFLQHRLRQQEATCFDRLRALEPLVVCPLTKRTQCEAIRSFRLELKLGLQKLLQILLPQVVDITESESSSRSVEVILRRKAEKQEIQTDISKLHSEICEWRRKEVITK